MMPLTSSTTKPVAYDDVACSVSKLRFCVTLCRQTQAVRCVGPHQVSYWSDHCCVFTISHCMMAHRGLCKVCNSSQDPRCLSGSSDSFLALARRTSAPPRLARAAMMGCRLYVRRHQRPELHSADCYHQQGSTQAYFLRCLQAPLTADLPLQLGWCARAANGTLQGWQSLA
jgi:hypothetical protein